VGAIAPEPIAAYQPNKGLWEGHPGPAPPPGPNEPLRVIVGAGRHPEAALALANSIPQGAVTWLFVCQAGYDDNALGDYGEVRTITPGAGHRMFWEWLQAVLDFRPHLVHAMTHPIRQWAEKCGLPWVWTEAKRPAETSLGMAFEASAPLTTYRTLLAPMVDIIVVASGQAEVSRMCLTHIVANTWWPYRLVLVNNGSADDGKVAGLFRDIQAIVGADHCHVIDLPSNIGGALGRLC